jgi:hypothetical protein
MIDYYTIYLFVLHCTCYFHFNNVFCLGLIQPLTSNLFMCECGHGLDTSSMHLTHCPFGG